MFMFEECETKKPFALLLNASTLIMRDVWASKRKEELVV